jgi:hypothetical protein
MIKTKSFLGLVSGELGTDEVITIVGDSKYFAVEFEKD